MKPFPKRKRKQQGNYKVIKTKGVNDKINKQKRQQARAKKKL